MATTDKKISTLIQRKAMLKPVADDNGVLKFSISSDIPARGMFGDREVLDHSPEAIDLQRVANGSCPILLDHRNWPRLGKILRGASDGHKLQLEGLFDLDDEEVKPIFEKIKRGFLTEVSVTARPTEWQIERDAEGELIRFTKWELIEASIVSGPPEDHTVGIGRSLYQPNIEGEQSPVGSMTGTVTPPQDLEVVRSEARQSEQERISFIYQLGEKYKDYNPSELVRSLISEGKTEPEIKSEFAELVFKGIKAKNEEQPEVSIGLSKKESRQYSILRAYRAALTRRWDNAGLEKEAAQAVAEQTGQPFDPNSGKVPVPMSDLKVSRAALEGLIQRASLTTNSANIGELITEEFRSQDLITLGREASLSNRLNITMLRNLQGSPIRFPKQIAGLGFDWRNETTQIQESELGFNSVSMTPKEFGGIFFFSYLAEHQAEIPMGLEAFARRDFTLAYAEFLDQTWLNGSGQTAPIPIPRGVINQAGLQQIAGGLGTDGGVLNPEQIKELITAIQRTKLCQRDELSILSTLNYTNYVSNLKDSDGRYLWMNHNDGIAVGHPNFLWSLPYLESTHMPEDLTKGAGTDLSALIVAPFSRAIVLGEWYGMMMDTSIHHKFDTAQNAVRFIGTLDVINRMPECCGIISDISTP